jgi:hypothetical protein
MNTRPVITASIIALHFYELMGKNPAHASLGFEWEGKVSDLLNTLQCSPAELMDYMRWAATENTDPKPQFNSVEYLAKSNDPMATLVKHSVSLYKVWWSRKRSAEPKVKAWTGWKPIDRDAARWSMLGPGVNQPLNGWVSARQKLDAYKSAMLDYRPGWQTIEDPISLELAEELFASYQAAEGDPQ